MQSQNDCPHAYEVHCVVHEEGNGLLPYRSYKYILQWYTSCIIAYIIPSRFIMEEGPLEKEMDPVENETDPQNSSAFDPTNSQKTFFNEKLP